MNEENGLGSNGFGTSGKYPPGKKRRLAGVPSGADRGSSGWWIITGQNPVFHRFCYVTFDMSKMTQITPGLLTIHLMNRHYPPHPLRQNPFSSV